MITKNFKILLAILILVTNGLLFSMRSFKEETVNEETFEDTIRNSTKNLNQNNSKNKIEKSEKSQNNKNRKNYITSNYYCYNRPINNGCYTLEFEANDKIKIIRQEENKEQKKEKDLFIKLRSQKNTLSMVLASTKENSPLIAIFTQKFNFNLKPYKELPDKELNNSEPGDSELSKKNFCQIMLNPENNLTIYDNKTGEPVIVLSDTFEGLKTNKISNIIFGKNDTFVLVSTDQTVFIYDLKKNKVALQKSFDKKIKVTLSDDEQKVRVTWANNNCFFDNPATN
jgi:hypothetical protein